MKSKSEKRRKKNWHKVTGDCPSWLAYLDHLKPVPVRRGNFYLYFYCQCFYLHVSDTSTELLLHEPSVRLRDSHGRHVGIGRHISAKPYTFDWRFSFHPVYTNSLCPAYRFESARIKVSEMMEPVSATDSPTLGPWYSGNCLYDISDNRWKSLLIFWRKKRGEISH